MQLRTVCSSRDRICVSQQIDFDFLCVPQNTLSYFFLLLIDENGFILRAEKVWIQKEVAQASLFAIHCSAFCRCRMSGDRGALNNTYQFSFV